MARVKVRESDITMKVIPDEMSESGDAVAVFARVELRVPHGKGFILVPMQSPGLWDIQGADDAYLKQVFEEEKSDLIALIDGLTIKVSK